MSIAGPSGAGGAQLPPSASSAALRRLVETGFLDGRMTADLGDRGLRISTVFGPITITEAALPFVPGQQVRLRYDARTGRVVAEPEAPRQQAGGTLQSGPQAAAQPPGQEGAPGLAPQSAFARPAALPSAVLAGLQPLTPGAGHALGVAAQAPAAGAPESILMGFLASLLPGALPADREERLRSQRRRAAWRAYTPFSSDPADPAPDEGGPAPADPQPLFTRDETETLIWISLPPDAGQPALDGEVTEDLPGSRASFELRLADGTHLQVEARHSQGVIRATVRSDLPLADALIARIRQKGVEMAQRWEAEFVLDTPAPAADSAPPAAPQP